MKRFIFHWLDGTETCTIADTVSEAAEQINISDSDIDDLDYYEEQEELPLAEKKLLLEDKDPPYGTTEITNPLAVVENIRNSDVHVGSGYLCTVNGSIACLKCIAINASSIVFTLNPTKLTEYDAAEFLAV